MGKNKNHEKEKNKNNFKKKIVAGKQGILPHKSSKRFTIQSWKIGFISSLWSKPFIPSPPSPSLAYNSQMKDHLMAKDGGWILGHPSAF